MNRRNHLTINAVLTGLLLLVIFVGVNEWLGAGSRAGGVDTKPLAEREILTDTAGFSQKRLAFHDFEGGNAADTASHLALSGFDSRQSLRMNSFVNFSPGLAIRFSELDPPHGSWLRITARVWFTGDSTAVKSSLVVTCNHKGINYKYQSIPMEYEGLAPARWNRVTIDYSIPEPPDPQDLIQVYFWYRGAGEMLVDDIETVYFKRNSRDE